MIPYTEFDIQATAYGLLHEAGYIVSGEVHIGKTNKVPRGARFDLVIYSDRHGKILLTIEVKRSHRGNLSDIKKRRYEALVNAPCIVINGMTQAKDIVAIVEAKLTATR